METESISFVILYLGVLLGVCLVAGALFAMFVPHVGQDIGWDYTQICIGAGMGVFASGQFIYFLNKGESNTKKANND